MIVTVTERELFLRCRRKWDFGSMNRQGIERILTSPSLNAGTVMHKALADWLLDSDKDPVELVLHYADEEITKVKTRYTEHIGVPPTDDELSKLYESINMCISIASNYRTKWGCPVPNGFNVVQPEQKVEVPIPNTEHYLEGKLDGIIESQGRLFILEHKTYGSRPTDNTLNNTDQFTAYVWILKQLNLGPVAGIAYDGMWKRDVPPRNKTFDDLFLRTTIIKTPQELAEYESELVASVIDMANDPFLYKNRRWEGCYDCSFDMLCSSMSRGEDWEFLRDEHYCPREEGDEDN